MAVIARGSLAERSAPRLLAALARKGFTGELLIEAGARPYRIAWSAGAVVGAHSGHPADSAAKVAIGLGLLNSTQAGEVARIVAGSRGVDELEVVAQAARLSSELLGRLARRVVAARAARAMSADTGNFVVDDTLPAWGNGTPIDARWILYSGLRTHYTVERAERELAGLAAAVRLRTGADLDGFGFGAAEEPVVARLQAGDLALAPMPAGLDHQVVQAMALALLFTGEAEPVRAAATPSIPPPVAPGAAATGAAVAVVTPSAPGPGSLSGVRFAAPERAATPSSAPPAAAGSVHSPAAAPGPGARTPRSPSALAARDKVRTLIAERVEAVEQRVDHFALLGVARDAGGDEIRAHYFALARSLHPDRLTAVGIDDEHRDVQRLFARINEAFAVLSDPERRARYRQVLAAGGEAVVKAREAEAEAAVRRTLDAEERFRVAEMALRRQQLDIAVREFGRAVQLNPEEADYHAMLGWAIYVAAADKSAVLVAAHGHLAHATERNPTSPTPHLYLGRIARMEGNDGEAIREFQRVLELVPGHNEAAAELRAIESRKGTPPERKSGGLFSRLGKKP